MRGNEKNIVLIVPCYNEESRLGSTLKVFLGSPYRFIFVDDGSTDGTRKLLERAVSGDNRYIALPDNSGKAEAVRQGMLFLDSRDEYKNAEWVGYWDADMATPIGEIERFLCCEDLNGGAEAVYGSRIMRLGSTIKRNPARHVLGRIFCTLISLLFGMRSYDTQCGAKIFRVKAAKVAFKEPFISKFIFDVEIILRLKDYRQIECPVAAWEDVKGSKITVFRTFARVVSDILRIYRKYR